MLIRRAIAVVVCGLVGPVTLLGLGAGASSAGDALPSRVVLRDDAGDVWVTGDGEQDVPRRVEGKPTVDVTRVASAHRRRVVVVRMRFADLRRVAAQSYGVTFRSSEKFGLAMVSSGPGTRAGRHRLVDGAFAPIKCRGFTHDIDYAANRVVMRIPRSCLGNPRWVRLSMDNFMFSTIDGAFKEFTDNPHNRRASSWDFTRRLHRRS